MLVQSTSDHGSANVLSMVSNGNHGQSLSHFDRGTVLTLSQDVEKKEKYKCYLRTTHSTKTFQD